VHTFASRHTSRRHRLRKKRYICSRLAAVDISSSILNKSSEEEQAKFKTTSFYRTINEIEYWARIEKICDFFGVEDGHLAVDICV
tara:strand:+ start:7576 stop:7830 length:255 start_codon:yes stop_codon:yes gene_type:complete